METTILHKVYSNNSKKSRLKRSKRKHIRVWDSEKQTYVKMKRQKTTKTTLTDKQMKEIFKTKVDTPTKPAQKVQKPENKKPAKVTKNAMPARKAVTVRLYGKNMVWDTDTLRYKAA